LSTIFWKIQGWFERRSIRSLIVGSAVSFIRSFYLLLRGRRRRRGVRAAGIANVLFAKPAAPAVLLRSARTPLHHRRPTVLVGFVDLGVPRQAALPIGEAERAPRFWRNLAAAGAGAVMAVVPRAKAARDGRRPSQGRKP
jgi:hypothetical protein